MRKLAFLRAHLTAAAPGLAADPDRLLTFVERGQIEWHRGGNDLTHGYRAEVRLTVLDWQDDLDAIVLPLLDWLAYYQPDVVPETAVRFEVEVLGSGNLDLSLLVTLTERVVVQRDALTGALTADHRLPEFPADADCSDPVELWSGGVCIASWPPLA